MAVQVEEGAEETASNNPRDQPIRRVPVKSEVQLCDREGQARYEHCGEDRLQHKRNQDQAN